MNGQTSHTKANVTFNTEEGYAFVNKGRSNFSKIFSKSELSNKSKIKTIESEIKYSKSLLYNN
jgi:hypothetical protein